MTLPTHFTAWLVNDASALDSEFMDVTIIEDELIGADPEDQGAWASNGKDVFHAVTTVEAKDGDIDDAIDQARDLMSEAGWRIVGDWDTTDNAYIVTIEHDETSAEAETVTLISATSGDQVPGHELADPECLEVPGLRDRPEVKDFFAANNYDADHEDELMYLAVGDEVDDVPPGFPTLTLTLPLS